MNKSDQLKKLKKEVMELECSVINVQNVLINYAEGHLKNLIKQKHLDNKIESWFLLKKALPKIMEEIKLKKNEVNLIINKSRFKIPKQNQK
jgi:hypothetical protein